MDARLIFLAENLRQPINSKVKKFLPYSDLYNDIAKHGIDNLGLAYNLSSEQIRKLYNEGKTEKIFSEDYINRYTDIVLENAQKAYSDRSILVDEYISIFEAVRTLRANSNNAFIDEGSFDAFEDYEYQEIEFPNANYPTRALVGDLTNGLMIFAAKAGTGKTSFCISYGLEGLEAGTFDSVHFIQTELGLNVMKRKVKRVRDFYNIPEDRKNFKIDVLTMPDVREILREHQKNPNDKRLFILDSPDTFTQSNNSDWTSAYELLFQDLLKFKAVNKMVLVTSQLNNVSTGKPTAKDITGSYKKYHYADYMFGMWRNQVVPNSAVQPVWITCIKSREKPILIEENQLQYGFNYETLRAYDLNESW